MPSELKTAEIVTENTIRKQRNISGRYSGYYPKKSEVI